MEEAKAKERGVLARIVAGFGGAEMKAERLKEFRRIKPKQPGIIKQVGSTTKRAGSFFKKKIKLKEYPSSQRRGVRVNLSKFKRKRFSPQSVKLARFVSGSRFAMPIKTKGEGVGTHGSRIGRPRGPSGKYYIPQRGAVGVYQWRRWARQERAMQRMRLAQQLAQMPQRYPQRQYYPQEQYPQQTPQQTPQQYPLPQAPRQQIIAPPIQNYPPETQGVGLTNGWDLLKIGSPSFQPSAPPPINPFKGAKIFNSELPVTNPQGDYYTEPDLFTGRQILKRRFRDRTFQS